MYQLFRFLEHIGSGKKQSEKTRQERLQLKTTFKSERDVRIPKKKSYWWMMFIQPAQQSTLPQKH